MIQATENYVLVEIEKKFQDSYGNILIDPTWTPEEYATLEGVIVSVPKKIIPDDYREIKAELNVGDKIFFSYGIIFSYHMQPDEDTPVYKNLVLIDGKEYWKVDVGEIFCKSENTEMVTNHLLIEPKEDGMGIIKGIPKDSGLSIQKGQMVLFEQKFATPYEIFGKQHLIIPSRRAIAWI